MNRLCRGPHRCTIPLAELSTGAPQVYAAFHPSFAYMKPAISGQYLRPLDTCGEESCNSQFIPFAFDELAHRVIHLPDILARVWRLCA